MMSVRPVTALVLSLVLLALPGATARAVESFAMCKADAARICPGIAPGGGKLAGCLKQHEDEVSIGCAKSLRAIKAKLGR